LIDDQFAARTSRSRRDATLAEQWRTEVWRLESAMFRPLAFMLQRVVRKGSLVLVDSAGRPYRFGDDTGAPVVAEIADRALERQLALDPQLALGEGFMQGRFRMREGTIYDFLALVLSNLAAIPQPKWLHSLDRVRILGKPFQQFNPAGRSKRNVAHHYDIDGAVYDLFLDRDRQYSCAYFEEGGGLEEAQLAKKRHIAAKLALKPGHRVLDIGSGWGGLGLYLAELGGCEVTGITLSEEQLAVARRRARDSRAANRLSFELADYRTLEGTFDRIVSVGMFEHVGVNHYSTYFRKVHELLDDDGVALIHTIGRSDTPTITNPFIAKYIFPGGYIPSLSEVMPAIERAGLVVADVEVLRLHYAETLRAWRERFLARRKEAVQLRGEEFARMWEFYLAGSETAFRYQGLVIFQIQLIKRVDALPIRRDYMPAAEQDWRTRETIGRAPGMLAGE
jgi:cyclopropane-fatty-acyl-phospholipid synthase